MSTELYIQNIKKLDEKLGLSKPIELDSSLGVTLILNHKNPLVLHISYDIEQNLVQIQSHITTHFPKSRIGVQTIMNELVGDLLLHNRSAGKLKADPTDNSIQLIKTIDLKKAEENTLALFLPLYTKTALTWREKFDQVTLKSQKSSFNREEEILSFHKV